MGEKRERGRPRKQEIPPRPDIEAFRTREPYRRDDWGGFVEIPCELRDAIVKYIDALEKRAGTHFPARRLTADQQRAADAEANELNALTIGAESMAESLKKNGIGVEGRTLHNWRQNPDYIARVISGILTRRLDHAG